MSYCFPRSVSRCRHESRATGERINGDLTKHLEGLSRPVCVHGNCGRRSLSARPDSFRAAQRTEQVDLRLHPGTLQRSLTLAISHLPELIPVKITETYRNAYQSLPMDPDFDRSDFNSRHLGVPVDSAPSIFPSTFYKRRRLQLARNEINRSLSRPKALLIPAEISSEIFLFAVQADPSSRRKLMLVCRRWHNIMLSTPGIYSHLGIYSWTRKKYVERFGRKWLLHVTVHPEYVHIGMGADLVPDIDPVEFHACFMAAAETASRWRLLEILSLPHPEEYKDLQIKFPLQHPESFKYLESFRLATGCDLGNYLEPLLNVIIATVTPRFTVMEVFRPEAALYILQSAHFQIFSSLTTLRLTCRRMQNPVDILPSLHKLEIFEAHHLFLPVYPPGIDLPLTQSLRVLRLKSVSVQWMASQMFPALKECSIIFPHHADAIQSVDIPSCSILRYDSNNLSALEHFHISTLGKLEINCGQWTSWSGDLQLICLHPIFAAQSLTCLHLAIKCSERLLTSMLRLVPALEELWMGLSSPHALSTAFFLALAAGRCKANPCSSNQMIRPLGRKLRMLHLHYKRWLRGPERNSLIPVFGAVVASHPPEDKFSFYLSLDERPKLQEWYICGPAERFDIEQSGWGITIGVPSPDGIVHLSKPYDGVYRKPLAEWECIQFPRETEYIIAKEFLAVSNEFLFSFLNLKEVRVRHLELGMMWGPHFPLDAPLFHTLKVLYVDTISLSFFAGQTFHKLERYGDALMYECDISEQVPLTKMPVCTRLIVSLYRLATLKLPKIRELGLSIDADIDHIWEKYIVVNTNLSGLKLLHLRCADPPLPTNTVIGTLRSLPALETLIIDIDCLIAPYVDFFKSFVPMNGAGPSGLNQSSREGQLSGVLCPRLRCLQIEGISLTQQAELMLVLESVVILRAIIGSPLRSFTFYLHEESKEPQKWQLIGRDRSFMMEKVFPARLFELDI